MMSVPSWLLGCAWLVVMMRSVVWNPHSASVDLKDLLAQMGRDAEEDQDVYDKVVCWREINSKENTKR